MRNYPEDSTEEYRAYFDEWIYYYGSQPMPEPPKLETLKAAVIAAKESTNVKRT